MITALMVVAYMLFSCNAQIPQPIFRPAQGSPISIGDGPVNVAIGDLDKDNKPDLVVARGKGRSITVLLGRGDGQFRASGNNVVPLPDPPGEMVLGDLNGDAKPDLAIASHDSYGLMFLAGDGNGGFNLAGNSPIIMREGQRPHTHGLQMGDMNGDGNPDLVTANSEDNDISVAYGDGNGSFTRADGSPFKVERSPYPLALGDLNNDGIRDIVSTSTAISSKSLTVLFGDGTGGFKRTEVQMRTAQPWFVAIGDLNGDLRPDLAATHAERRELTVLIGDGEGGFTEAASSPFFLAYTAWGVYMADVNYDGKADILAAAGDGLSVMSGDGLGGFKPVPGSPFLTGKGTWRLAIGDLNNDGKHDVATSNLESNNVTILLGR